MATEWDSPLLAFMHAGHVGVDLFFVLSGFLLARPFLAVSVGGRQPDLGRYFTRRALRILPLYYLTVVLAVVLTSRVPAQVVRGIPYLLFLNSFAGAYTPMFPWSVPWWSLATEVQFYVVLPLLGLFVASTMGRRIGVLALLAYAVAFWAFEGGYWHPGTIPGYVLLQCSLFGRGFVFLSGVLAAWIYDRHGARLAARLAGTTWVRRGGADVALLLVLVALAYLLRWVAYVGYPAVEVGFMSLWHTAAAMLWAAIMLLLLLAPLRARRIWSNEPLRLVGVVSYSFFLLHVGILHITLGFFTPRWGTGWTVNGALLVAAVLALTLLVSTVSYRLIERPFLIQKARVGT